MIIMKIMKIMKIIKISKNKIEFKFNKKKLHNLKINNNNELS